MIVVGKRLRRRMESDQNLAGDSLTITLNDSQIEKVTPHKFLGVEIDDDLDFEDHCEAIAKKVSKTGTARGVG